LNAPPRSGQIGAIGLYGDRLRTSYGSAGGWDAFGPKRKVTRSNGRVLYSLDGEPALDLYTRYLGDEAEGLPMTGLYYPMSVRTEQAGSKVVVRTLLAVDNTEKSITFAGSIPEGATVQLMHGAHERLVDGASDAGRQAWAGMNNDASQDVLTLLISCVGRRLLMTQRCEDEVDAVGTNLGDRSMMIGMHSFGELTPNADDGKCELQNQTMTIMCISETLT